MQKTQDQPKVTVIVPMKNEARHIRACLEGLAAQTYPARKLEIIVVDDHSTDSSPATVKEFGKTRKNVRLLNNRGIHTSAAMNTGVLASSGEIILILGAHSSLGNDYILGCSEFLASHPEIDCVGGALETRGVGAVGTAIAIALSSPSGIGNARFRYSSRPGLVDTVAFGAYRRSVFDRIGLFDETMDVSNDDEFNYRLLQKGGRIFLLPEIKCVYHSRDTYAGLYRQYFRYGRIKIRLMRKLKKIFSARHLAPLAFLCALAASGLTAGFTLQPLWLLAVYPAYFIFTLFSAIVFCLKAGKPALFPMTMAAYHCLHFSYGLGMAAGFLERPGVRPGL